MFFSNISELLSQVSVIIFQKILFESLWFKLLLHEDKNSFLDRGAIPHKKSRQLNDVNCLLFYEDVCVEIGISIAGVIWVMIGVYKSTSVLGVDRETTSAYRTLLS